VVERAQPTQISGVTEALRSWRQGDVRALGEVFDLVQAELKRLAAAQMARERPGHTLQPTALVNELYLRLAGPTPVEWRDRRHFIGIAAHTMGQILIDHARKRGAQKRGSEYKIISLNESLGLPMTTVRALDLGSTLMDLGRVDPRKRKVVEYHCLGLLAIKDCAALLGVSPATAKRDWRFSRAWLIAYLGRAEATDR